MGLCSYWQLLLILLQLSFIVFLKGTVIITKRGRELLLTKDLIQQSPLIFNNEAPSVFSFKSV